MKRLAIILVLGMFLASAAQPVSAQPSGRRAGDVNKRSQKWAVLVGVDQYEAGKLRYCTDDATALVGALSASGFNEQQVYALTDNVVEADQEKMSPTKENLNEIMGLVLSLPEKDDLVVVGFFGMGVQVRSADGKKTPYLCPKDGVLTDVSTLIPLSDVFSRLETCPARFKVLVLDVNRESSLQIQLPEGMERLDVTSVASPFGVQILSSVAPGEISREDENSSHSVFAQYLLTGVKDPSSGADWNEDGEVSIQELFAFVKTSTKAFVARNFFARQQVTLYGETFSDFALCAPTAVRRVGRDQRVLPLGASLQTAIDRALPNSRIIVAQGTCNLPRTVVVDRPVEIVGESPESTVFACSNGPVFDIRSKGVVIRNLGVKGLGSRSERVDDFDSAICVRNSDARIIGCVISSAVRNGVYAMVSQSTPYLVRCTITDCGKTGVRAAGGSNVTVRECLLTKNGESGVSVAPFTKAVVQHCTISNCDVGLDVDRMGYADYAQLDFIRNGEDAIRVVNAPVIGFSGRGENVLSVVHFKDVTGPYEDVMASGSHSMAPVSSVARSNTALGGMNITSGRSTGMNITSARNRSMFSGAADIVELRDRTQAIGGFATDPVMNGALQTTLCKAGIEVISNSEEVIGFAEKLLCRMVKLRQKHGNGAAQHHAQYPVGEYLLKLYGEVIPQIYKFPMQNIRHSLSSFALLP